MRFVYFLLITFVFTACGHSKIRFSKVDKNQKIVEISEIPSLKKKKETAYAPQSEAEETLVENNSTSTQSTDFKESQEENAVQTETETNTYFPKVVEDSTTITVEEVDDITEEALRAEKNGTRSMVLSILIFVFGILGILSLFFAFSFYIEPLFAIMAALFGLLLIASLVLSLISGISSLRAAYNTPLGRKRAIIGISISSIFLFLFLLNIFVGLF